jgi:hypothetical protein
VIRWILALSRKNDSGARASDAGMTGGAAFTEKTEKNAVRPDKWGYSSILSNRYPIKDRSPGWRAKDKIGKISASG